MKTPASLNEMIALAICTCPAGQGMGVAVECLRQHFKDFLAQRFCEAILKNPEAEKVLFELWADIAGESVSEERRVG